MEPGSLIAYELPRTDVNYFQYKIGNVSEIARESDQNTHTKTTYFTGKDSKIVNSGLPADRLLSLAIDQNRANERGELLDDEFNIDEKLQNEIGSISHLSFPDNNGEYYVGIGPNNIEESDFYNLPFFPVGLLEILYYFKSILGANGSPEMIGGAVPCILGKQFFLKYIMLKFNLELSKAKLLVSDYLEKINGRPNDFDCRQWVSGNTWYLENSENFKRFMAHSIYQLAGRGRSNLTEGIFRNRYFQKLNLVKIFENNVPQLIYGMARFGDFLGSPVEILLTSKNMRPSLFSRDGMVLRIHFHRKFEMGEEPDITVCPDFYYSENHEGAGIKKIARDTAIFHLVCDVVDTPSFEGINWRGWIIAISLISKGLRTLCPDFFPKLWSIYLEKSDALIINEIAWSEENHFSKSELGEYQKEAQRWNTIICLLDLKVKTQFDGNEIDNDYVYECINLLERINLFSNGSIPLNHIILERLHAIFSLEVACSYEIKLAWFRLGMALFTLSKGLPDQLLSTNYGKICYRVTNYEGQKSVAWIPVALDQSITLLVGLLDELLKEINSDLISNSRMGFGVVLNLIIDLIHFDPAQEFKQTVILNKQNSRDLFEKWVPIDQLIAFSKHLKQVPDPQFLLLAFEIDRILIDSGISTLTTFSEEWIHLLPEFLKSHPEHYESFIGLLANKSDEELCLAECVPVLGFEDILSAKWIIYLLESNIPSRIRLGRKLVINLAEGVEKGKKDLKPEHLLSLSELSFELDRIKSQTNRFFNLYHEFYRFDQLFQADEMKKMIFHVIQPYITSYFNQFSVDLGKNITITHLPIILYGLSVQASISEFQLEFGMLLRSSNSKWICFIIQDQAIRIPINKSYIQEALELIRNRNERDLCLEILDLLIPRYGGKSIIGSEDLNLNQWIDVFSNLSNYPLESLGYRIKIKLLLVRARFDNSQNQQRSQKSSSYLRSIQGVLDELLIHYPAIHRIHSGLEDVVASLLAETVEKAYDRTGKSNNKKKQLEVNHVRPMELLTQKGLIDPIEWMVALMASLQDECFNVAIHLYNQFRKKEQSVDLRNRVWNQIYPILLGEKRIGNITGALMRIDGIDICSAAVIPFVRQWVEIALKSSSDIRNSCMQFIRGSGSPFPAARKNQDAVEYLKKVKEILDPIQAHSDSQPVKNSAELRVKNGGMKTQSAGGSVRNKKIVQVHSNDKVRASHIKQTGSELNVQSNQESSKKNRELIKALEACFAMEKQIERIQFDSMMSRIGNFLSQESESSTKDPLNSEICLLISQFYFQYTVVDISKWKKLVKVFDVNDNKQDEFIKNIIEIFSPLARSANNIYSKDQLNLFRWFFKKLLDEIYKTYNQNQSEMKNTIDVLFPKNETIKIYQQRALILFKLSQHEEYLPKIELNPALESTKIIDSRRVSVFSKTEEGIKIFKSCQDELLEIVRQKLSKWDEETTKAERSNNQVEFAAKATDVDRDQTNRRSSMSAMYSNLLNQYKKIHSEGVDSKFDRDALVVDLMHILFGSNRLDITGYENKLYLRRSARMIFELYGRTEFTYIFSSIFYSMGKKMDLDKLGLCVEVVREFICDEEIFRCLYKYLDRQIKFFFNWLSVLDQSLSFKGEDESIVESIQGLLNQLCRLRESMPADCWQRVLDTHKELAGHLIRSSEIGGSPVLIKILKQTSPHLWLIYIEYNLNEIKSSKASSEENSKMFLYNFQICRSFFLSIYSKLDERELIRFYSDYFRLGGDDILKCFYSDLPLTSNRHNRYDRAHFIPMSGRDSHLIGLEESFKINSLIDINNTASLAAEKNKRRLYIYMAFYQYIGFFRCSPNNFLENKKIYKCYLRFREYIKDLLANDIHISKQERKDYKELISYTNLCIKNSGWGRSIEKKVAKINRIKNNQKIIDQFIQSSVPDPDVMRQNLSNIDYILSTITRFVSDVNEVTSEIRAVDQLHKSLITLYAKWGIKDNQRWLNIADLIHMELDAFDLLREYMSKENRYGLLSLGEECRPFLASIFYSVCGSLFKSDIDFFEALEVLMPRTSAEFELQQQGILASYLRLKKMYTTDESIKQFLAQLEIETDKNIQALKLGNKVFPLGVDKEKLTLQFLSLFDHVLSKKYEGKKLIESIKSILQWANELLIVYGSENAGFVLSTVLLYSEISEERYLFFSYLVPIIGDYLDSGVMETAFIDSLFVFFVNLIDYYSKYKGSIVVSSIDEVNERELIRIFSQLDQIKNRTEVAKAIYNFYSLISSVLTRLNSFNDLPSDFLNMMIIRSTSVESWFWYLEKAFVDIKNDRSGLSAHSTRDQIDQFFNKQKVKTLQLVKFEHTLRDFFYDKVNLQSCQLFYDFYFKMLYWRYPAFNEILNKCCKNLKPQRHGFILGLFKSMKFESDNELFFYCSLVMHYYSKIFSGLPGLDREVFETYFLEFRVYFYERCGLIITRDDLNEDVEVKLAARKNCSEFEIKLWGIEAMARESGWNIPI